MILFCDTSALVKLYVKEEGSDAVLEQAAACESVAACRIAWVEMMSAFSRRVREQPRDSVAIAGARRRFAQGWPQLVVLDVTQALVELAGDYTEAFSLRAYDSLQLAAVASLHHELPGTVRFACADHRLSKAAQVLGIAIM